MTRPAFAAARAQQIADEAERHYATAPGKLFIPSNRAADGLPDTGSNLGFDYVSIDQAFPDVKPGCEPLGNQVLLQIRQPLLTTSGGLRIDAETRKTEFDNTQVAKVIAVGSLAFHTRDTGQEWPEGSWCQPGDFVRIGKYQGDRWAMPFRARDTEIDENTGTRREIQVMDRCVFLLIKDLAIFGKYPTAADAMAARAYL